MRIFILFPLLIAALQWKGRRTRRKDIFAVLDNPLEHVRLLFFCRRSGRTDHPAAFGAVFNAFAGFFGTFAVPDLVETILLQQSENKTNAIKKETMVISSNINLGSL